MGWHLNMDSAWKVAFTSCYLSLEAVQIWTCKKAPHQIPRAWEYDWSAKWWPKHLLCGLDLTNCVHCMVATLQPSHPHSRVLCSRSLLCSHKFLNSRFLQAHPLLCQSVFFNAESFLLLSLSSAYHRLEAQKPHFQNPLSLVFLVLFCQWEAPGRDKRQNRYTLFLQQLGLGGWGGG